LFAVGSAGCSGGNIAAAKVIAGGWSDNFRSSPFGRDPDGWWFVTAEATRPLSVKIDRIVAAWIGPEVP
jgi:hypothetical protein